jgi:hypothetical protein
MPYSGFLETIFLINRLTQLFSVKKHENMEKWNIGFEFSPTDYIANRCVVGSYGEC